MTHVYVIQAEGGPVKVGVTADVLGRLHILRNFSPLPLNLVHVEDVGCPHKAAAVERTAHAILAEARSHGEWFNVPAEAAMEAIRAAIQDPHSGSRGGAQRAARGQN